MTGKRVSHFEFLEKLGEGGMGVVYKARDVDLDRLVAIKILSASQAANSERRLRFIQEAKAASALNHPNIVTISEIFREDKTDFIAMELIRGHTLEQAMGGKAMKLPDALPIASQVADALAAAHASGITHRDLKPANIMVTGEGRVKVLDFGLAKLTERTAVGPEDPTVLIAAPKTELGTILGTIAYMSPEQAEGKEVDWRSDIFSFGSVLYELVTGRRAFAADGRVMTLAAVVEEEPASIPESAAPRELVRTIARCMRKKPADRSQSMLDVKHLLDEIRVDFASGQLSSIVQPVHAARERKPWGWVAAAVVLFAIGIFAAIRWTGSSRQINLKVEPLTSYPGVESYPSLSPDGKQIAFSWDGPNGDNADIYISIVGAGDPLRLTKDPAEDVAPAWSRDGRYIAFFRRRDGRSTLHVIPALGGEERKLAQFQLTGGSVGDERASWSPDGKQLLVSENHALAMVDVASGASTHIALQLPIREEHIHPRSATYSPDGKQIAFAVSGAGSSLLVVKADVNYRIEGPAKEIVKSASIGSFPWVEWTSSGDQLLYTALISGSPVLHRVGLDGDSPKQVAGIGEHVDRFSIQGNRLVYTYRYSDSNLYRVGIDSTGRPDSPKPFLHSTRREERPKFSPDGSRIAFQSDRSGESALWVTSADATSTRKLTPATLVTSSRWSPDGLELFYVGVFESALRGMRVGVAGGTPRVLAPPLSTGINVTPDGKWGVYQVGRGEDSSIPYRQDLASSAPPTKISDVALSAVASFSPDSSHVYFTRLAGKRGLWSLAMSGGTPTLIPGSEGLAAYTESAPGIYFVRDHSNLVEMFRHSDGKIITVARFEGPPPLRAGQWTVSPDGRTLIYMPMRSVWSPSGRQMHERHSESTVSGISSEASFSSAS
ncbi:MAG: PD40 domain-containing protein [Candidatus Solibacter usitatus]|nr:PD40 domain-containing protein [Candidatus Solibacter usitatus]